MDYRNQPANIPVFRPFQEMWQASVRGGGNDDSPVTCNPVPKRSWKPASACRQPGTIRIQIGCQRRRLFAINERPSVLTSVDGYRGKASDASNRAVTRLVAGF